MNVGFDDREKITIGRAPDSDIVIDHASISGTHAVFDLVDGRYTLSDLGSTNGTFVEGAAIGTDAPLATGMKIVFGTVEVDYESEVEEQAAPAEATEEAADDAESGYGGQTPVAVLAETSARPAGYNDLSPIEKVEKKDQIGQAAMAVGVIGILAAIGLAVAAAMMKAS